MGGNRVDWGRFGEWTDTCTYENIDWGEEIVLNVQIGNEFQYRKHGRWVVHLSLCVL